MTPAATTRTRVRVRGLVQGVGFRPFVYQLAQRHHLTGWVLNDEEGVLLEVQGDTAPFLRALQDAPPPLARVDAVEALDVPQAAGEQAFVIAPSERHGRATAAIGADQAPCPRCLDELFDPRARRYRYPFLNCTDCGPRYTITRGLPYDRPQTSMAAFPLCEDCRREYDDPLDRRFHAQPIACPRCGPHLSLPIDEVARRLGAGQLVALKGVGGFLLACDATNEGAVAELRARKERDAKPFAVMVAGVASARRFAHLSDDEAALLQSQARPIVVVRRAGVALASSVAPRLPTVGLMLPSSPLHALLFHELAGRPNGTAWLEQPLDVALVMTSANPGGEPLVIDDAEARAKLGGIADCVVTHGRDVVVRTDDSVVRVVAGRPTFIRRARGYVPTPVPLADDGPPVLAVGGLLKATVCLTRGKEAFVSQHVGDLDDAATFRFLEETIAHLCRTLEVTPALVAHDLHPDFLSTRAAHARGVPTVAVQHHHAHLAAVQAEHGLTGPAVGLALDGYGYGDDGGAWGGELLLVDGARHERLGHLRPLRLPGGDAAARAPWRMAAAALHALGRTAEVLPRFAMHGASPALLHMLERGVRAPWTTSLGRWFDAACGLLGVLPRASYEGEAPMVLEGLVSSPRVLAGAYRVRDGVLDLLPLLSGLDGRTAQDGAELFHGTLAQALVDWTLPALRARGLDTVLLGGGCVMNGVLTQALLDGFAAHGVRAVWPKAVPANDGGLSLGQAWVAQRWFSERGT